MRFNHHLQDLKPILFFILFLFSRADALCVSSFQARLRAEPNGNSKITWVVGRYMPLVEIDRKGSWYKVKDQDNETHWISVSDVTSRIKCVAVKTRRAELRTQPSGKSPLHELRYADRYTAFKRIEADPEFWYSVEDESGEKFWIAASQVWRPVSVSRIGF